MDNKVTSHWKKAPPDKVEFFNRVLENHPDMEKRKMFGYPCAFLGGNMFFGLFEDLVFLRLAENDRKEILALGDASAFEPLSGRVMKEYITLSPAILSAPSAFEFWFLKSREYAAGLPLKEKKGGKK